MSPDTAEVYGFGKSEEFLAEFANEGARNGLASPIIGTRVRRHTAAQQDSCCTPHHTTPNQPSRKRHTPETVLPSARITTNFLTIGTS